MVSKVAGYYTTDQAYRNVGSNHLSRIAYNPNDLVLYIEFYNGSKYAYYGVPKGLYDGLMKSPSHGVFFWSNIRQVFPFDLIDEFPNSSPAISNNPKKLQKNSSNSELVGNILPENKKLDVLDKQQQELDRLFKNNSIGYSEYEKLSYIIDKKKEPLLVKLEKIGYFEEPDQVLEELEEQFDEVLNQELDIEFKKSIGNRIKSFITSPNTQETIKSILTGTARTLWITTLLTIQALKMLIKGYMMLMGLVFGIIGALMS